MVEKGAMRVARNGRFETHGSTFIVWRSSLMEVMLGFLCSVMMISLLHNVLTLPWYALVGEILLCALITAAALWWRTAGLLVLLTCALFSSFGCAGLTDHSESPGQVIAAQRYDDVLRATRVEAATLRSEMAATRIAAAKKDAELQELRRQQAGLRQAMETKQNELLALREERDHLLQVKGDFQIQLAEVPQLRQSVIDARTAETALQKRLKDLETALMTLSADIAQVKKELDEVKATPPQVQKTKTGPTKASATFQASSLPLLGDKKSGKGMSSPLKKSFTGAP